MYWTHRHSLRVGVCDEDVSVGHRHQRGENLSFLGAWNQLESEKTNKIQNIVNQKNKVVFFLLYFNLFFK